ncbi:cytochrome P450 [Nonomuraea turcica]|uniref:cytochrome P450 n=1 Tax=Nonomuraea sp. G32 TaxID=3067274 RepID=UPI00273B3AAC|nr:cytochrome P450 [Nonomuraea sp. G32]MDP4511822.1 cytochrome P450 [Nonomuraea sp. G32]
MTATHETARAAMPPGPYGTLSPTLAERRSSAPLAPMTMPSGADILTAVNYDDVQGILACPGSSRDLTDPALQRPIDGLTIEDVPGVLLNMDPPDHSRQRRILRSAFTVQAAERWRQSCHALAHELLDPASAVIDLVAEYALPLASRMICQVLGIPAADYQRFHTWSTAFLSTSSESVQGRMEAYASFMEYVTRLVDSHRANPGDDLLDELIRAHDEGDQLTETELVNIAFMIITAGHETTAMMVSRGVFRLLLHPQQYQSLVEDPALIPSAVEEILRYDGPGSPGLVRHATTTVELPSGAVVPPGTVVLPHLAAANHDPQAFRCPERFDIRRYEKGTDTRGHLAFGYGPHYCLGHAFARMELQEALRALTSRAPALRCAIPLQDAPWTTQGITHKPVRLPVRLA